MSDQSPLISQPRKAGQLAFALGFLVLAVFLLSQIGTQTKWIEKSKLFAQPRFWPAVSLTGMVLFGALHLWRLPRRHWHGDDRRELRYWARPILFAAAFMGYVWAVPLVGFLLATLVFSVAMTWAVGYRAPKYLWSAAALAIGVVILFKSLLSVKIPGGAIYEFAPGALRNFLILYL